MLLFKELEVYQTMYIDTVHKHTMCNHIGRGGMHSEFHILYLFQQMKFLQVSKIYTVAYMYYFCSLLVQNSFKLAHFL